MPEGGFLTSTANFRRSLLPLTANRNHMNIKINGFQHLGIPVTNLKNSENFYEGLGFKNVMTRTFDLNGGTCSVSMMQRDQMIIEIYELPEPDLAAIRQRGNGHIDHMAFDVDDIEHTFQQLKSKGYHVVEEAPVYLSFWEKGCRFFNILGPDGERLEFNQIL